MLKEIVYCISIFQIVTRLTMCNKCRFIARYSFFTFLSPSKHVEPQFHKWRTLNPLLIEFSAQLYMQEFFGTRISIELRNGTSTILYFSKGWAGFLLNTSIFDWGVIKQLYNRAFFRNLADMINNISSQNNISSFVATISFVSRNI